MRIKTNTIVIGGLALALANEIRANFYSKKRMNTLSELITYMADVLDKNEIPLSDFDEIAIEAILASK